MEETRRSRTPSPTRLAPVEKGKSVPAELSSKEVWLQPVVSARKTVVTSGLMLSPRGATLLKAPKQPRVVEDAFAITPQRQQELDAKLQLKIDGYLKEIATLQDSTVEGDQEKVRELKDRVRALTTPPQKLTKRELPALDLGTLKSSDSNESEKRKSRSFQKLLRSGRSSGDAKTRTRTHIKRHTLAGIEDFRLVQGDSQEVPLHALPVTRDSIALLVKKRDELRRQARVYERVAIEMVAELGESRAEWGLPPDKPLSPKPGSAGKQPPTSL